MSKKLWSVFTDDMDHCYFTGASPVERHHIFGGNPNRKHSEEYGFVINGKFQKKDNVTIYPRDLFSGRNWFTGENEYTDYALGVHECVGGWADKNMRQAKIDGYKKLEEIFFGE